MMQKSFIAIALALTLTCAFAYYNPIPAGYVTAPVSVASDSEVTYTNANSIRLISATIGELDLLGTNQTASTATTGYWNTVYRKLDGKTLAASTNSTVALSGTPYGAISALYINGYAVTLGNENDGNNIPQISVYQNPLNGGAALPKIFVSTNNNSNFTPKYVTYAVISKTVYVFYQAVNTTAHVTGATVTFQINVTNFVVGGAKGTNEFNLTTGYIGNLSVAWGEALDSNKLFANWIEGGVLRDATIDVSKGIVIANIVIAWSPNYTCQAFSTDKKWFGDLCYDVRSTPNYTNYYVRSKTTSLIPLTTNATNTSAFNQVVAYGPYIAIIYTGTVVNNASTTITYGYEIWNLDNFTLFQKRTTFLTADLRSFVSIYRVPSGGLYTLLANTNSAAVNSTTVTNYTNIQVGLLLDSYPSQNSYAVVLVLVTLFVIALAVGYFWYRRKRNIPHLSDEEKAQLMAGINHEGVLLK